VPITVYNFTHPKGSLKVVNNENGGGVRNVANCPYRSGTVTIKVYLKVHKNENFFGFDFEFCTISVLVMHK
jgi:hypothetical protein